MTAKVHSPLLVIHTYLQIQQEQLMNSIIYLILKKLLSITLITCRGIYDVNALKNSYVTIKFHWMFKCALN